MNCRWEKLGEPEADGWQRWQCVRPGCKRKTNPTPHTPDRIYCRCVAWPAAHEWGEWLALALEVIGLNQHRWNWLRPQFGFTKPCNCDERRQVLNGWGQTVSALLKRVL